ncbi:syntaxin-18 [Osmia bicornis bicornis]|uniref:syntaxin-18 n=1 Tax=Osmia bicornis bicornis TaxID=1437191 RepID=UPI0010F52065|nr:syntaxin-18 [Osmia bicornis bicornis]XP_029049673.1 syntaxin-18 [Osmia bicornis bicornis]XP_029049674.1 syntaxin-18 [Osmia bicornis bicornis]XP_029049675.1 syntaxin-18 [Osmia bicornis bicornis]XP_046143811.1 syntaxin-18 [Osmia bicornis bicornis]
MDVSSLFKASVKTVSLRNRDLGTINSIRNLKKVRSKSAFFVKAQGVVAQISKLREFLIENRKAYLNFSNYLPNVPSMTDVDRDQIDVGAQKIMSTCSQLIKELRREIAGCEVSPQNLEHREIMLLLIEDYLKNVCKIYSEQKAMRVKRAMEIRKIAKLELNSKSVRQLELEAKRAAAAAESNTSETTTEDKENKISSNNSSPMKIQEINGDVNALMYEEEEISADDIQLFEAENEQLYNELNMLTEEVKQIETKVVHIAELQEIFTEKVLDQDKDLDRLTTTVVGSTENVKEANEQIRQAIQRNAGLRVWILFFLLVMSFSLLFLDWYNP